MGLPIKVERAIRQQLLGGEASVLLPSLVAAQATASLNGRVTDESGGVLPGVTVTVTQTDTGLSRSVVTEATGEWLVPKLPTGPYRLEVALFGNHERNSIRGPGFWKIDLAISRLFTFSTSHNVEVRLEAFNLLNNFNWGNPIVNFSSGLFGRIQTVAGDMRIMQFGVKYSF